MQDWWRKFVKKMKTTELEKHSQTLYVNSSSIAMSYYSGVQRTSNLNIILTLFKWLVCPFPGLCWTVNMTVLVSCLVIEHKKCNYHSVLIWRGKVSWCTFWKCFRKVLDSTNNHTYGISVSVCVQPHNNSVGEFTHKIYSLKAVAEGSVLAITNLDQRFVEY